MYTAQVEAFSGDVTGTQLYLGMIYTLTRCALTPVSALPGETKIGRGEDSVSQESDTVQICVPRRRRSRARCPGERACPRVCAHAPPGLTWSSRSLRGLLHTDGSLCLSRLTHALAWAGGDKVSVCSPSRSQGVSAACGLLSRILEIWSAVP